MNGRPALKGKQRVGILGGMGPSAGVEFVRLFLQACKEELERCAMPVIDQAFPEHYLVQAPIPDRSTALKAEGAARDGPLEAMSGCLAQLSSLGVSTVAIACNTAHAWHAPLQGRYPNVDILHVAREVARLLARRRIAAVGLLATEGTYRSGVYEQALGDAGVKCHIPTRAERSMLMNGIYDGVKRFNMTMARDRFQPVAEGLVRRTGVSTLILGCTEIPLVLRDGCLGAGIELIDPAKVLARRLACAAYGVDRKSVV